MPLVSMKDLLQSARDNRYAVGYFESWNLESLLAVADAAELARSPVIIGFNGGFLENPVRRFPEHLTHYAALGRSVAQQATVPMALLLNEAGRIATLIRGLESGFNAVMYASPSGGSYDELVRETRCLVDAARVHHGAVEGELGELPWADRKSGTWGGGEKTDPETARKFVHQTGVDALAVAVGNVHVLETEKVSLDFPLLRSLCKAVPVPLVLHGGTGIDREALREAVSLGITKVNVGTLLKRTWLNTVRTRLSSLEIEYSDPHELLGQGGGQDVLQEARDCLREEIGHFLSILGSAGKA
ncbi:MAG TPA: class II fructose-bisphosphate aldolase [Atribacteraceae bacterium]|nr:class II fructose-bisphosphate aldolase [Atribacteraceae bacterium]